MALGLESIERRIFEDGPGSIIIILHLIVEHKIAT